MGLTDPVIVDKLIYLCYGGQKKRKQASASKVLYALKENFQRGMMYEELCQLLGLDANLPGDRVQFRRIIEPMTGKNDLHVHILSVEKVSGKKMYFLSYESFSAIWKNLNQQAKEFLKNE